ncbi:hypothetical protein [Pedobacter jeongneungensis]|uniref:hypothetical protein n=1 Tax=Pedobacter jeongneungensis TaxID=947309 RepID=UPI000468A24B|nr:hypothetical protein [Pedobacter jeongneungensis]
MIKLHYIHEDPTSALGFFAYLLLQEKSGDPFMILREDEILGELAWQNGRWLNVGEICVEKEFLQAVGRFIDAQAFSTLPAVLLTRWPDDLAEVVVQSESDYLLVCKLGRDFVVFERIFREFISGLIRGEGLFSFKVFDAGFDMDFELNVEAKAAPGGYAGIEKWQV